MKEYTLTPKEQDTEEHWISISDMMAGLMVIFLFIAISYMLHIRADKEEIEQIKEKIEQIAVTYEKLKSELYNDLEREFKNDLNEWNAVLDRQTLSVRFKEPEVLFEPGDAEVRPAFKKILDDFFPRYIQILRRTEYINDIAEIRIEGHTSSEWQAGVRPEAAYIHNMELSQERTRSVLEYVLKPPSINEQSQDRDWLNQEIRDWLKQHLTANGLSSSKLIRHPGGTENKKESRRVEFRVRTNAEKRIAEILKQEKKE